MSNNWILVINKVLLDIVPGQSRGASSARDGGGGHTPSPGRGGAESAGLCESYAPMGLSYLFQVVENELDSGKLCAPLCGSSLDGKVIGLPAPFKTDDESPLKDTCGICEKAASKVHDFLSQPGEIDKIINFVEEVCDLVPSDDHDKCVSTITGFGPMVLNYIVGLTANPQQACQEISLC